MASAQFKVISATGMLVIAVVAFPALMFLRFITTELVEVIKSIAEVVA